MCGKQVKSAGVYMHKKYAFKIAINAYEKLVRSTPNRVIIKCSIYTYVRTLLQTAVLPICCDLTSYVRSNLQVNTVYLKKYHQGWHGGSYVSVS